MEHGSATAAGLRDVLGGVVEFLERFVCFERPEQATALALWCIHTHVFEAFPVTPYLWVKSPEKQSGKTRLLEVLELLVAKAESTANISPAALYRLVQERQPTLLMDEVDAVFAKGQNSDPGKQDLRGLLNAGYQKGKPARRTNPKGDLLSFEAFCPKALAGIGSLPDTIADRSIPIALQRKPKDVEVERFNVRRVSPLGRALHDKIEAATEGLVDLLADAQPDLPKELNDRAQDIWEPLFAIADRAGGGWPDRARKAAIVLAQDALDDTETTNIQLLADIRSIWRDDEDSIPTEMLIGRLCNIEEAPWTNWYGREIDARWLAGRLKPFGVKSCTVRHASLEGTKKGYRRKHLEPVWNRYLNSGTTPSEHPVIDNYMDPF